MHQDQLAIVMKKRKKATPKKAASPARGRRKVASAPRAKQSTGSTLFTLATECMVAEASAFRKKLGRLIDVPHVVTLDIAPLRRIDTAGLQVLAAFVRERESKGRSIEWRGSAPALSTAARLLGLASSLRLPQDTDLPDMAP